MEFVTYEQTGHIAVMTINRPKALNALNKQVLTEINEVLDQVDVNTVRCMIVTGAGEKSFVAGADIGEMSVLNREEGVAWASMAMISSGSWRLCRFPPLQPSTALHWAAAARFP